MHARDDIIINQLTELSHCKGTVIVAFFEIRHEIVEDKEIKFDVFKLLKIILYVTYDKLSSNRLLIRFDESVDFIMEWLPFVTEINTIIMQGRKALLLINSFDQRKEFRTRSTSDG
jgi:hypothetical protein